MLVDDSTGENHNILLFGGDQIKTIEYPKHIGNLALSFDGNWFDEFGLINQLTRPLRGAHDRKMMGRIDFTHKKLWVFLRLTNVFIGMPSCKKQESNKVLK